MAPADSGSSVPSEDSGGCGYTKELEGIAADTRFAARTPAVATMNSLRLLLWALSVNAACGRDEFFIMRSSGRKYQLVILRRSATTDSQVKQRPLHMHITYRKTIVKEYLDH